MGLFDRLFKSRKDTPIVPPKGFVMAGPAVDALDDDQDWDDTRVAEDIDGLVMAIEYIDTDCELSSRMITCRAIRIQTCYARILPGIGINSSCGFPSLKRRT